MSYKTIIRDLHGSGSFEFILPQVPTTLLVTMDRLSDLRFNTEDGPASEAVVLGFLVLLVAFVIAIAIFAGPAPSWEDEDLDDEVSESNGSI